MRKTSLGLVLTVVLVAVAGGAATPEKAANVFESSTPARPANQIDKIVFAKLASLDIDLI